MTDSNFDASKYLTKLSGKDYLEVKWRLLWLRTLHPDAVIETELVKHGAGLALFRARVTIPGAGSATGWGSETAEDFGDFIEKAETKALGTRPGRAGLRHAVLRGLRLYTPRPRSHASGALPPTGRRRPLSARKGAWSTRPWLATASRCSRMAAPSRHQLRSRRSTRARGMPEGDEDTVEGRCRAVFSCLPAELTKQQASEFIDLLRETTSRAEDQRPPDRRATRVATACPAAGGALERPTL